MSKGTDCQVRGPGFESQLCHSLHSCVFLGKSLNFAVTEFPHFACTMETITPLPGVSSSDWGGLLLASLLQVATFHTVTQPRCSAVPRLRTDELVTTALHCYRQCYLHCGQSDLRGLTGPGAG